MIIIDGGVLTSTDLKKAIAQKTAIAPEIVAKTLDIFQKTISTELSAGRSVNFPGFGNFVLIKYPPRTIKDVRNPAKTYLSLEKNKARFRPSIDFKKELQSQPAPPAGEDDSLFDRTINVRYIDLVKTTVPKKVLNLLPEHIARHYQVVPLEAKGNTLVVAMIDPEDREAIEFVKKKTGMDLDIRLCTQSDINHILDQYSAVSGELKKIIESAEEDEETPIQKAPNKEKMEEITETAPAAKIVQSLIKRAVREKASDIHVEPQEEEIVVRFREDGILKEIIKLPKEVQSGIISRIKILSDMKIDETRLPQDGRFQTVLDGAEVDFRVSTLPTVNGEKVVMRILDKSGGILTLEQLGLRGSAFEVLDNNIRKAHGMVLVTGPTGSGKTTTLYAVIDKIKNVGINIVTLEDPVEYRIPRINQSQVYTKINFTFANGLRSIVRQDPDVIMIGEIRDYETADMAIHAALTGHVVLSTLHTNDAAGAIPRMMDMKIEPFLINSSVNCIVAQRLCRRICDNCKEEMTVDDSEQKLVEEELKKMPEKEKRPEKIQFFHGKGCENCSNSGYKGRLGIFEVFDLKDNLKELVAKKASGTILGQEAVKNGMVSMKQDGILKIMDGLTTLEEVWRVTKD
ncbi:MAG: Type II secretion system protein E (GspE) [Berkelbacteria bacterium GW2011_GWA1_36_9]|uniref:Type II secretion system protein E (GspE) n=1 Tax=Berkelbacteria bacterium GW2011_GWA1_36_9 TaxID=1618331 RepID=A0A0G0FWT0_9BACT|nr:MAG: Type II secretion system protein E (GspE) [Berkelbacteria bacterium GW2011_GWA1_36_9]